jgi:D-amino peptidase
MLVAVSVDMEGASQLRSVREIFGCFPEYWETGRPLLEADVSAACDGLLAGGASELVVLDNHGGNTVNVSQESLPHGARLETWNVFELGDHGVDAMFQIGYHARGGVEGFLSHTYIPGLRLRVDDELISESHGRAWAAEVPLLGIVGNDMHERTLGSLAGTPFLVVQKSVGRGEMRPVFGSPEEGFEAIRAFAEQSVGSPRSITAPVGITFGASMPNAGEVAEMMADGGWTRVSELEFEVDLERWSDARKPLDAAMNASFAPFLPYWQTGFDSGEDAAGADQDRVAELRQIVEAWASASHPEWYTATDS